MKEPNLPIVRRLIETQFPKWKDLPISPVAKNGWDNNTYHLGPELLIRMPSAEIYESQVEKEQYWLPKLAPLLPCQIPTPIAMGQPDESFPWKWSIYQWIEGETVAATQDLNSLAKDLARFLFSLHQIDPANGPTPGLHSFHRGGDLSHYDSEVREALARLKDRLDTKALLSLWENALATSWSKPPVWVHGDISAGNLLVQNNRLKAVIDFGQLTTGDPACDLAIAWTLFKGKSRDTFRSALNLDENTWLRGEAWVLWKSLIVAAGFSNPGNTESNACWQIIEELL